MLAASHSQQAQFPHPQLRGPGDVHPSRSRGRARGVRGPDALPPAASAVPPLPLLAGQSPVGMDFWPTMRLPLTRREKEKEAEEKKRMREEEEEEDEGGGEERTEGGKRRDEGGSIVEGRGKRRQE